MVNYNFKRYILAIFDINCHFMLGKENYCVYKHKNHSLTLSYQKYDIFRFFLIEKKCQMELRYRVVQLKPKKK